VATGPCASSGNRVVVGMFWSRNGVLTCGMGYGGFWNRFAVVEVVTPILFFPETVTTRAIGRCTVAGSWHSTWFFFTLFGICMSLIEGMPKLSKMIEVLFSRRTCTIQKAIVHMGGC